MRVIGKVIMNIGAIRHEYKDKNGGKELDRYCDTRFGTCCIMCESAKENKSALRKTVVSEAFDDFMKNKKKGAKEESQKEDSMKEDKEAKASVSEVVEDVTDSAKKEVVGIPTTSTASDSSLFDKYKKAFDYDGFVVTKK